MKHKPVGTHSSKPLLEKYNFIRKLGSGRFSEVFLVDNHEHGYRTVLKFIKRDVPGLLQPELEADFQRLCAHENIVEVIAQHKVRKGVIIEMEFMEDGSLADHLFRRFVPLVDGVEYLKQVLSALSVVHNNGIVHRDVSADNIMLSGMTAKLSDFGTALALKTGRMACDSVYHPLAPPEVDGHVSFSPAGDIFAAGITLLRMVNNLHSFHTVLTNAKSECRPDRNIADVIGFAEYVPEKLRKIIRKAVSYHPADRFPSADSFRNELNRLRQARNWQRIRPDTWRCTFNGQEEIARVQPGLYPSTIYMIGGKRRSHQVHHHLHEARSSLNKILANTTFP